MDEQTKATTTESKRQYAINVDQATYERLVRESGRRTMAESRSVAIKEIVGDMVLTCLGADDE